MFGILGWIVYGLIVGVVAKLLMPGRDPGGFIITALLGIAGAVVGGFIGQALGLYGPGRGGGIPDVDARRGRAAVPLPQATPADFGSPGIASSRARAGAEPREQSLAGTPPGAGGTPIPAYRMQRRDLQGRKPLPR